MVFVDVEDEPLVIALVLRERGFCFRSTKNILWGEVLSEAFESLAGSFGGSVVGSSYFDI
jgi:hypothetical protein